MHRHGYKGRKFHRETDQRKALIKGLADSLVKYEAIETTLPKAKEIVPYMEKLITKAKKADLHNRRQVISSLQTIESANKLFDELTPKLKSRNSGHLRISKTTTRKGDNAMQARVSFIFDEIKEAVKEVKEAKIVTKTEKPAVKKTTVKKPVVKKEVK
jgi:large subunit ribosomal protein L17